MRIRTKIFEKFAEETEKFEFVKLNQESSWRWRVATSSILLILYSLFIRKFDIIHRQYISVNIASPTKVKGDLCFLESLAALEQN